MLVVVRLVAMMSECFVPIHADSQPDVCRTTSPSSTHPTTSITVTPQQVSEAAKAEGGTSKGSESARLQSELDMQINAQHGPNNGTNAGLVLFQLSRHCFY